MNEHVKIERILNILFVLASGRELSINELAERYEISKRRISQYISSFRKVGLEVEFSEGHYLIKKLEKPFKAINDKYWIESTNLKRN